MLNLKDFSIYVLTVDGKCLSSYRQNTSYMRYSELYRILKELDCSLLKSGSRHDIWINAQGEKMAIPRHKNEEVPGGMYYKIMKWAGVN